MTSAGRQFDILLVKQGTLLLAYLNRCPHLGLTLNWTPNRFFEPDGQFLLCANHGARFRVDDGYCVSGPCAGQRLTPLPIQIAADDWIELQWQDLAQA